MFASGMKEAITSVVDLQHLNAVFAEKVSVYMHTGNIEINNVGEILAIAHYMQIEELMKKCELFIKNNADEENCLFYCNLSKLYGMTCWKRHT